MAWQRSVIKVYRGWIIYEAWRHLDGKRESHYSARHSRELKRKFMNPPYWPVPECESAAEVRAWVDEDAPYKLPTDN